jgi:aminoglycoside phosphotransferase (APT) family kinase protein
VSALESWVRRETGGTLSTRLEGATSSVLYDILIDGAPTLIVRTFTNSRWLAKEPDLAIHEAAALRIVESVDIHTPELVAVDETGEHAGVPSIVMTRLPGAVDLPTEPSDEWLFRLAQPLATVHTAQAAGFAWSYDAWVDDWPLRPPSWSTNPNLWKRAFSIYGDGMPNEPGCLLHRDYHPTNVLWNGGAVSGVVDWVNACVGPPSADIAHCRLNLALMYGIDAADRFSRMIDSDYDPVWDLAPALSGLEESDIYPPWITFGLTHLTSNLVRKRLEEFVRRAC